MPVTNDSVDQASQQLGDVVLADRGVGADRFGGRNPEVSGEERDALEHTAFVVEQEVVAPVDHGAQRLLTRERGARADSQQPEPVVEPAQEIIGRERAHPRRGELDRERKAVEAFTESRATVDAAASSPRTTARRRVRAPVKSATASSNSSGARGQSTSPAIINGSRLVVRTRNSWHRPTRSSTISAASATTCSQLSRISNVSRPAEELAQPLAQVARRTLSELHLDPQRVGDRVGDAGRVGNRREVGHVHAVFELGSRRRPTSIARRVLPTPPVSDDRRDPMLADECGGRVDLRLPADEHGRRRGQIVVEDDARGVDRRWERW